MSRLATWLLTAAYLCVVIAAAPLLVWSRLKGKRRAGFFEKAFGQAPLRQGDRHCVWLHAVSVGEVNLLATIIQEFRRRRPEWELVVSTTTKTGFELAHRKYGAEHTVFYCPLDFSWAVRRAMARVRPDMLVLAELELWPNLISIANSRGAKVAIINGRLSDNSFRGYSRVSWLVSKVLGQIDVVAAQDETTADRFRELGAPNVHVTGSLKYDGAQTSRTNPRTTALKGLAGIGPDDVVWLVGSTQAPEEEIAMGVYQRIAAKHPRLRLVIVPRHPERFPEVASVLQRSGVAWRRRSEIEPSGPRRAAVSRWSVLLVDAVGELGAWWGAAQIGFVGGSFGDRGGQNMIEPAAYGVATCFGPNTRNFRDIVAALTNAEGAVTVQDAAELEAFVLRCLKAPDYASGLGSRAAGLVASQLGATNRTVDLLLSEGAGGTARSSLAA